MKHEQPDIYQNTAMFADIKTYIFYQLYGEYVIDHSMASATGMFNLQQLDCIKKHLNYSVFQPLNCLNLYQRPIF